MLAAGLVAGSLPAAASLGDDVSTVQADAAQMRVTAKATQAGSFAVHELKSENGALVREYASPAGKVFAVTWQTAGYPDLRQLLGTYYQQFQSAAQAKQQNQRVRRAPLLIHEPGLVVEISGAPRHFVGRAYVPGLLPAGVAESDIR